MRIKLKTVRNSGKTGKKPGTESPSEQGRLKPRNVRNVEVYTPKVLSLLFSRIYRCFSPFYTVLHRFTPSLSPFLHLVYHRFTQISHRTAHIRHRTAHIRHRTAHIRQERSTTYGREGPTHTAGTSLTQYGRDVSHPVRQGGPHPVRQGGPHPVRQGIHQPGYAGYTPTRVYAGYTTPDTPPSIIAGSVRHCSVRRSSAGREEALGSRREETPG